MGHPEVRKRALDAISIACYAPKMRVHSPNYIGPKLLIAFPCELIDMLTRLARDLGVSRSELVRQAVREWLAK